MGSDDKYTDPKLKKEVEEEVKSESKGGGPGGWSAYKAQQLSKRYKERGGEYTDDKKGKGNDNGKAAETSNKSNGKASDTDKRESETESKQKPEKHAKPSSKQQRADKESEDGDQDDNEYTEEGGNDDESDGDEGELQGNDAKTSDANTSTGQKRSRGKEPNGTTKKQKDNSGTAKDTVGSKHRSAEEPAPKGSVDRLPKKGQKVQWRALPGYVHGEVVEVLHDAKEVEGKQVKASKGDPRIVLKSDSSGKICAHKPEAVFFE